MDFLGDGDERANAEGSARSLGTSGFAESAANHTAVHQQRRQAHEAATAAAVGGATEGLFQRSKDSVHAKLFDPAAMRRSMVWRAHAMTQDIVETRGEEEVRGAGDGKKEVLRNLENLEGEEEDDDLFADDYDEQENDEDDEDFLPMPSDDEFDEEEEQMEEQCSELDDEDASVAGLLPLQHTKKLQFRRSRRAMALGGVLLGSDDEDDSSDAFTSEDAALWTDPNEKRQWIARYQDADRAFQEQYGCRIDSVAMPDSRQRLRLERRREGRYTMILVALALAYLARVVPLPLGPWSNSNGNETATTREINDTYQAAGLSRLVPWWRSVQSSWTWEWRWMQRELEAIGSSFGLSPIPETAPTPTPAAMPVDPVIAPVSEPVQVPVATEASEIATLSTTTDRTEELSSSTILDQSLSHSSAAEEKEQVMTTIEATMEPPLAQVMVKESVSDMTVIDEKVADVASMPESLISASSPPPSPTASESLALCEEFFFKVMKSKSDTNVASQGIQLCTDAMAGTPEGSADHVTALVVRGDMFSLLQEFRNADKDYAAALVKVTSMGDPTQHLDPWVSSFIATVQLKALVNKWIELYTKKDYKALRVACLKVVRSPDAEMTGAVAADVGRHVTEDTRELARQWLRVFKREVKVFDVLTASRSWTVRRPKSVTVDD